jgi:hypothetical protein
MTTAVPITLQPTGHAPITMSASLKARFSHLSGKRTIEAALYWAADFDFLIFVVNYHTEWERELPWCWVFQGDTPAALADVVREQASGRGFLPPGAGYPATEAYRLRQDRLRDEMNGAVLHLLTKCLA